MPVSRQDQEAVYRERMERGAAKSKEKKKEAPPQETAEKIEDTEEKGVNDG